jgi:tetrahydromethanopterin S-methyltransferase subunit A
MIDERKLRAQLAPTDVVGWVKSYFEDIEKKFRMWEPQVQNVIHINMQDIDSFKKSVEDFKKVNPNANIQATAFVFSTKNPELNQEYKSEDTIKQAEEMKTMAAKKQPKKVLKKSKKQKK